MGENPCITKRPSRKSNTDPTRFDEMKAEACAEFWESVRDGESPRDKQQWDAIIDANPEEQKMEEVVKAGSMKEAPPRSCSHRTG